MRLKEKDGLLAPSVYFSATEEEKKEIINNCGPDGFLNHLVPNSLLGANISSSCAIHDWTFFHSRTEKEHKDSDALFLKNMLSTVDKKSKSPFLRTVRKGLAYIYYGAVRIYSRLKVMTTPVVSEKKV